MSICQYSLFLSKLQVNAFIKWQKYKFSWKITARITEATNWDSNSHGKFLAISLSSVMNGRTVDSSPYY